MTVCKPPEDGCVYCEWFNLELALTQMSFHPDTLAAVRYTVFDNMQVPYQKLTQSQ
jgi:uncharacterized protein YodC (DUF2158 family)